MLPLQFYKLSWGISTLPENSTASEEAQNATFITTVPSILWSGGNETDLTATCTKYATQSTIKPPVQLKVEPLCTESGSTLDQLIRFIGYQFDSHICGDPDSTTKYTEILYCSMLNIHTTCLQPFKEELKEVNTEIVPPMSTVRRIIEKLCAMKDLLAKDCMFKRLKHVSRCVKTEVDSILALENKRWIYGAIDFCRHLEVKVMCMWEGLLPCNEKTAGLMAGLIGEHLRLETCTLSGAQMVQPFSWLCFEVIFVMLIFLHFTGYT